MAAATTTRLYEAIWQGEVASVVELLRQDPLILDRCIDQCMQSPLHVAATVGNLEVVQSLLAANSSLCLAHDQDERTPIHVAATKGHVVVLQVLHQANPCAAQERNNKGESILHLCVKHSQLEALKTLLELTDDDGDQLINSKDNNGNTILHLAVTSKQPEMVDFILGQPTIEKNAVNNNEMTAVDIHRKQSRKCKGDVRIEQSLNSAKAKTAKDAWSHEAESKWLEKQRSALMVVASLIATIAFQVGINPPGGVWQESKKDQHVYPLDKQTRNIYAGTAIWSYYDGDNGSAYSFLQINNTVGLLSSLSVTLYLISGLPCKRHFLSILRIALWIAMTTTATTYLQSVQAVSSISRDKKFWNLVPYSILAWLGFMGLIFLGNVIRLIIKVIGWKRRELIKKLCKKIFCCN